MKVELTKPQIKMLISAAVAYMAGEWGEGDSTGFNEVDYQVLDRAVTKLVVAKRSCQIIEQKDS